MLPGALTQKVGPLPAWAWGLLVGAGVLGWAYFHHSSAGTADDQAAADAAAGDQTGTAGDPGNLQNVDGTNPLDFAGPTSGASFGGGDSFAPAPPANARLDPAQWRRLQAELAAIRKWEHNHPGAPKHRRHRGVPRVVHGTVRQPTRQRPRVTSQVANSGSGQLP